MVREFAQDVVQLCESRFQLEALGPRRYSTGILGIAIGRREHRQERQWRKPSLEWIGIGQKFPQNIDAMAIPPLGPDTFGCQKRQQDFFRSLLYMIGVIPIVCRRKQFSCLQILVCQPQRIGDMQFSGQAGYRRR